MDGQISDLPDQASTSKINSPAEKWTRHGRALNYTLLRHEQVNVVM